MLFFVIFPLFKSYFLPETKNDSQALDLQVIMMHFNVESSAVTNLSNLLTIWDKQDLMGRKLLVKTLYPKGIVVDREKILYRTQNQNVFIEYIQDVTGDKGQTKKRNSELKFNYSALVESMKLLSNL